MSDVACCQNSVRNPSIPLYTTHSDEDRLSVKHSNDSHISTRGASLTPSSQPWPFNLCSGVCCTWLLITCTRAYNCFLLLLLTYSSFGLIFLLISKCSRFMFVYIICNHYESSIFFLRILLHSISYISKAYTSIMVSKCSFTGS